MRGRPVIILTSVGAKSGKIRKTPLMRVEHDGDYAVVASLGGAPENPVWYNNLAVNPHVELQDGPVKKDYQAREVHDAERATWWERAGGDLAGLRRVPEEDDPDDPAVRAHADRRVRHRRRPGLYRREDPLPRAPVRVRPGPGRPGQPDPGGRDG